MTAAAESSTALVTNPATGESIDLVGATDQQLATAVIELNGVRDRMKDFEAAISDELLARLDREGEWTLRVPHPRQQDRVIKITAPSPDAGTSYHDPDALESELHQLVVDEAISVKAAGKALGRTVTVVFELPIDQDLAAFIETARKDARVVKAEPELKVRKAGINALAKLGKANEAIATALRRAQRRAAEPPARRASVKLEDPKRGQ